MKITNVKAMVAKMFTVGLVAAAVVVATPSKAQAQVAFGVRVGPVVAYAPAPVYGGPAYTYGYFPGRDAWLRHQEWERHEAFERREAFEHRDFHGHDFDRDRHFDRR